MAGKLIKAGLAYTICNVVLRGISFFTVPLFIRLLTPEEFGKYNVFISIEGILFVISGLAIHTSIKNALYDKKETYDNYVKNCVFIDIAVSILIGIIAGFVITALVLILGKNRMQKAIMDLDIPRPIRKLVPKSYFEDHLDQLKDEIRASFYESFEKEKNEEISERLVREISDQIEECLTNMARVVEIPLG